jgi:hypothetical protein
LNQGTDIEHRYPGTGGYSVPVAGSLPFPTVTGTGVWEGRRRIGWEAWLGHRGNINKRHRCCAHARIIENYTGAVDALGGSCLHVCLTVKKNAACAADYAIMQTHTC